MAKNNSSLIFLFILLGISTNCHTADQLFSVGNAPTLGLGALMTAMGGGHFYQGHTTRKALEARLYSQESVLSTKIQELKTQIHSLDTHLEETEKCLKQRIADPPFALVKHIESNTTRILTASTEQGFHSNQYLNATEGRLNAEIKAVTTSILTEVRSQEDRLQATANTSYQNTGEKLTAMEERLAKRITDFTVLIQQSEGRLQAAASNSHQNTGETLTAMEERLAKRITDFVVLIQQSAGDVKTVKDLTEKQEENATRFLEALKKIETDNDTRHKELAENYNTRLVAHLKSGVLLALVASSTSKITGRTLSEYLEVALAFGCTKECGEILAKYSMAPLLPELATNLRGGLLTDAASSETLLNELREGKTTFSRAESQRRDEETRKAILAGGKTTTPKD